MGSASYDRAYDAERSRLRAERAVANIRKPWQPANRLEVRGLLGGLASQDVTYLDLTSKTSADPRLSVRMGLAADGGLLAVAANETCLSEIVDRIRDGKALDVRFKLAPSVRDGGTTNLDELTDQATRFIIIEEPAELPEPDADEEQPDGGDSQSTADEAETNGD